MKIAVINAIAPLGCEVLGGRNARIVSLISVGNVKTKNARKKKTKDEMWFGLEEQLTSCTSQKHHSQLLFFLVPFAKLLRMDRRRDDGTNRPSRSDDAHENQYITN